MISLKNNAQSVLTLPLSATQTLLNLSLGDGAKFPVLSLGDHCWCALRDSAGNLEYVKVTERNGDILTVVRGQEGTPARYWATGTRVQLRLTARTWEDMAGEHWRRVVDAVGDPLVPTVTGKKTFTLPGNLLSLFEQTRSFRLYTKEGTFLYGYVASALASGDVTSVTVDGTDLPAVLAAVDVGLPLNVHPKAVNAAPVSHLTDSSAHSNVIRPILVSIEELKAILGSLVRPDGTIDPSMLPIATKKTLGAVIVGRGVSITDQGVLTVNEQDFETVPSAVMADNAGNAAKLGGKTESQLSVNRAQSAGRADSASVADSASHAAIADRLSGGSGVAEAVSSIRALDSVILPDGGTWFYYGTLSTNMGGGSASDNTQVETVYGVKEGGSKISKGAGASFAGFAVRKA